MGDVLDEIFVEKVNDNDITPLEQEAHRLSDLASKKYQEYNTLQTKIRKGVLKDIPNEIKKLEEQKAVNKKVFLSEQQVLNTRIKVIKQSKRLITKKAYLENEQLQLLKKEGNELSKQSQLAWQKLHELRRSKHE